MAKHKIMQEAELSGIWLKKNNLTFDCAWDRECGCGTNCPLLIVQDGYVSLHCAPQETVYKIKESQEE